jgi:hypothetical protein
MVDMNFRNILADELEDRGPLSNPHLAGLLRDKTWTPDKDSLWTAILRAMNRVATL